MDSDLDGRLRAAAFLQRVSNIEPSGSDGAEEPPRRLVALEDTGELLAPDARERVGQGLSRLLNVADGMMGQGLRVLFLIDPRKNCRPDARSRSDLALMHHRTD